jgi:pimeloyl-ACP methyl ester carboxylesterase
VQLEPFRRQPFDSIPDLPRRPHAYFASAGREIELASGHFGAHRVHYREQGSGPPLLLIHGLMTSSYSWRYVIAPLAERFRVIAPDLPGAGRSSAPDVPYTASALAGWIQDFVKALDVRGCLAIGNSMGGYLTMRSALADRSLFGRLINIHSPGLPEARLYALHSALSIPGLRSAVAWAARRDPERWVHRNVHYYDESLKSREEAREYGKPLSTPAGSRAFVRYLAETLSPHDMRKFARTLGAGFPIPLLLIYARQDPMVPPEMGDRLHALVPEARLEWLEQSSHFSHVDTPELFLEVALPFLSVSSRQS